MITNISLSPFFPTKEMEVPETTETDPNPISPTVNILIVDDLPSNLLVLRHTFETKGYKVHIATTGEIAIQKAQSAPIELILLDIKLPDADGYQVCQQLHTNPLTAEIPVIFLSAMDRTFDKVRGFAVGGIDYITKPFEIEEVLARVETQLKLRRLQQQLKTQNERLNQEIETRKRIEEDLYAEKELAQVTLHSIGDAVITTDLYGHIRYVNPIAEQITGWKSLDAKGLLLSEVMPIIHETTRKTLIHPVMQALSENRIIGLPDASILRDRHGKESAIADSAAPIRDRSGQVIGAVMVFYDVTESRQITRQYSWQASHDSLTGLINRRGLEKPLQEAISSAQRGEGQHCLCYLDLDQFKIVNDTCGHHTGDELLRQISSLLQKQARISDLLVRLGGDEFVLLLSQCPLSKALEITETIRQEIEAFQFIWNNQCFKLGISIGIVVLDNHSPDGDIALNTADNACYTAKNKGGNCVYVYHPDADIQAELN